MASNTVQLYIAWRLKPYCHLLAAFCAITDCEPDWDKFQKVLNRAIKIKSV